MCKLEVEVRDVVDENRELLLVSAAPDGWQSPGLAWSSNQVKCRFEYHVITYLHQ